MTSVAAIIPVYNGERFIEEAVQSALAQRLPPVRVVVVDDGSSDGTRDALVRFGDRIEVIRQRNAGVSSARNAGAKRCEGVDLLAFLDADDLWHPEKLARQVERFEADPDLGLVHCGVIEVDEENLEIRRRTDGSEGWVGSVLVRWEEAAVLGGGSGAVFRADLFRELGGYDPALSTSADWDLFVRFALAAPVGFVPDQLLRYRLHDSNMHGNLDLLKQDMTHAFSKVFRSHPELAGFKRQSLANLDYVLGGSYVNRREWGTGLLHLARAVLRRPALAGRMATRLRARRLP